MQMERPLISVIFLCYKNYRFIFDAINSLIVQDYPNIELIISNDCSNDFDVDELNEYFENYQTKFPNIKSVILNKNERNLGTTKHVNKTVQMSTGKYFKLLAVDDLFCDNSALTKYVDYFEANPDAYFVTTQCVMVDESLKNIVRYYPYDGHCEIIKTFRGEALFRELTKEPIIAAPGVCFSRRYIEAFGYFDEQYFFADDWPAWINFARKGNRIHFMDGVFIAYRQGGVSGNNSSNESQVASKVLDEYFEIMRKESLAYPRQLGFMGWMRLRFLRASYFLQTRSGFKWLVAALKNPDIAGLLLIRRFRKEPHLVFLAALLSMLVLLVFCGFLPLAFEIGSALRAVSRIFYVIGLLGLALCLLYKAAFFIYDFAFRK